MEKRKKELEVKQPLIKNVSLLGATMVLSSSIVGPGLSVTALAEIPTKEDVSEASKGNELIDNQTEDMTSSAMDIIKLDTVREVTADSQPFDVSLELQAHRQDNLDTTIQISPNMSLIEDDAKKDVLDETGKIVGTYHVESSLNKINITFNDSGFTKANLVIPVAFKRIGLSEQVVTASIGESVRSQTITMNVPDISDTSESLKESTINSTETSETLKESSTSSTDTSESLKESSTNSTKTSETLKESSTNSTKTSETLKESSTNSTKTSETLKESSTSSTDTSESLIESSTSSIETSVTTTSSSDSLETQSTEPVSKKDDEVKQPVKAAHVAKKRVARSASSPASGPLFAPTPMAASRAFTPQETFIANTAYHAQEVASQNGLYASVMIAQAILESGYGNSTLSSPPNHNLFGIKGSYNGQSVTMPTWEFMNGQNITINAQFRKYPSYRQSFEDNARVLKTTSFYPGVYFYSGTWKANTNSYRDATAWLRGRYATDPNYNTKLNNLIVTHNLTQYDTPGGGTGNRPTGNTTQNNQTPNHTQGSTYTVQRGDTLYGISTKYGVSVSNIKSW
ncbi:MAG: glucosaminidase domain-containing protein, partial [Vagococcus sp.]